MSEKSSSSTASSDLPGFKVDFEMKALLIAFIFVINKFCMNNTFLESIFSLFCRTIYMFGHIFFGYIYYLTVQRINRSTSRTDAEKVIARDGCRDLLKGVFVKSVVVLAIHLKIKLLPPLLVSTSMAFFSLIENGYIYQVMYDTFPIIFDVFFR